MAYDDRTEQPRTLGLWSSGGNWTTLFIPGSLLVLCAEGDSQAGMSGSCPGCWLYDGTSFLIRGTGS